MYTFTNLFIKLNYKTNELGKEFPSNYQNIRHKIETQTFGRKNFIDKYNKTVCHPVFYFLNSTSLSTVHPPIDPFIIRNFVSSCILYSFQSSQFQRKLKVYYQVWKPNTFIANPTDVFYMLKI